ncbi:PIN domain-containing protein [Solimicrobium silvestre]|uniref:PIN domain n=1 Tax=Solimicrobium silvestre TaxID=2099400 RepID=A0A2S9GV35_9BURK|nr:PIN domain-containing protein [Solimicrobium silvestre]PRC91587.1 PIN domain [Solimicrobium silvestre]
MNSKTIVLDANILIRAVLGKRARELIFKYAATIKFFAPEIAYADARKYLPALLEKRGIQSTTAMQLLNNLTVIIQPIELDLYIELKQQALERIAIRDADDWPILACAMRFDCPVWTEDVDCFGAGIATWTTDRVELYFSE